jgi:SAM-dependent methyltransferase
MNSPTRTPAGPVASACAAAPPADPFPYATAAREAVPCNLCGGVQVDVLDLKDRNDLDVRTCLCTFCGLIYLSPRMTPFWYGQYYEKEYRAQMARFKKRALAAPDHDRAFAENTRHGEALARRLEAHLRPGLTVEVGSSSGGVLRGFHNVLGGDSFGIEPSPDESGEANARGIRTACCPIESFADPLPPATQILCTQSLNHLLDPRYFLAWAHAHLAPEGRLVIEVMNFRYVFRRFGWCRRAIQIDHTYMFVPEVLAEFVQQAGFDLRFIEDAESLSSAELKIARRAGLPGFHTRLVAVKAARAPFPAESRPARLYIQVRESLDSLRNSRLLYFLKHELRQLLR